MVLLSEGTVAPVVWLCTPHRRVLHFDDQIGEQLFIIQTYGCVCRIEVGLDQPVFLRVGRVRPSAAAGRCVGGCCPALLVPSLAARTQSAGHARETGVGGRNLPWPWSLGAPCAASSTSSANAFACTKAARAIHGDCLKRMMHAPMSWFEGTPSGRILSRFSGDLSICDQM